MFSSVVEEFTVVVDNPDLGAFPETEELEFMIYLLNYKRKTAGLPLFIPGPVTRSIIPLSVPVIFFPFLSMSIFLRPLSM